MYGKKCTDTQTDWSDYITLTTDLGGKKYPKLCPYTKVADHNNNSLAQLS